MGESAKRARAWGLALATAVGTFLGFGLVMGFVASVFMLGSILTSMTVVLGGSTLAFFAARRMLRSQRARLGLAAPSPSPSPSASPSRPKSLVRSVVIPAGFVAGLIALVTLFFAGFLSDPARLFLGSLLAIVLYVGSRLLRYYEKPPVWGEALGLLLAGAAGGAVAMGVMNAVFQHGPGWPWTPWWGFATGAALGLQRAWRPVHKARLDAAALGVLLSGVALGALAAYRIFAAFAPSGVGTQRVLIIAATAYALHAARLLLAFAAVEREGRPGFVGWLRANALQNAVIVLILAGYLAFRDALATAVPHFPLVEFGLAVAVFGFALQRLRARLKREETPLASASSARAHERQVAELREPDYDAVARPIATFVETGRGAVEYAGAIAGASPTAPPEVFEAVRAYREPPVLPPLPLAWALGAFAITATGVGISAAVLVTKLMDAPLSAAFLVFLGVLGAAGFVAQDQVRSRMRPWEALGLAGGATLLLFVVAWLGLARLMGGALPSLVLYALVALAALMVGASALSSWRLVRRQRRGEPVGARESAGMALEKEARASQRRVTVILTTLVVLFIPVRFVVVWVSARGWIPDLAPVVLDDALGIAVWAFAGAAASAALRAWGLARHRPLVVAEERARRARRLDLHITLIRDIERT